MKRRFWSGDTVKPPVEGIHDDVILVFGSNPKGRHGLGVANLAMNHWGAKYLTGRGLVGRSYALVTKNIDPNFYEESTGITYTKSGYNSVTKAQIQANVEELYRVALDKPEKLFLVPYVIGAKNLNGYSTSELIECFCKTSVNVPLNMVFHETWKPHLR
ncbi:conserved hypothetical protein [Vibrio chagasii]|nr:conserved hypothetical protein [Vibrio chagasii]